MLISYHSTEDLDLILHRCVSLISHKLIGLSFRIIRWTLVGTFLVTWTLLLF